jgi:chromosome segregation protein
MVHIKQVELSHFKSFGGTTSVPILPGFTVISGPNGSGKSNILDGILFCLGLASSKGMRADRLPDLVNNQHGTRGSSEAIVTVTFDLSENDDGSAGDLAIGRRLRVNNQGGYTSTYYTNGQVCTLAELHEQLQHLRVYPEGYNVVQQGDVTAIVSMNGKERREIIDELAGVAAFDRKIGKAKDTLDEVQEKAEKCHIVVGELEAQRDRLAQDRIKAQKYQQLRADLQAKVAKSAALAWILLTRQMTALSAAIVRGEARSTELQVQLDGLDRQIAAGLTDLAEKARLVKALGEDESIALQTSLAKERVEFDQLQQQAQRLRQESVAESTAAAEWDRRHGEFVVRQAAAVAERERLTTTELTAATARKTELGEILTQRKAAAESMAAAANESVRAQMDLNHQLEGLLKSIGSQEGDRARLSERESQLTANLQERQAELAQLLPTIADGTDRLAAVMAELGVSEAEIQRVSGKLAQVEGAVSTQQNTHQRLLQEQRDKQRQLDKMEAQVQASQEAQGTFATKVIKEAKLAGVYGLVAQLGAVETNYQVALEIAAGARMGNLVVEDDRVAARAIELLKQHRAGRATFLPLNKINPNRINFDPNLKTINGFVDYAINLINYDNKFQPIFHYVFGNTIVFKNLDLARTLLGKHRIVTIDGELLESSGAMTGGQLDRRNSLHFGSAQIGESLEIATLRHRLQEIEEVLQLGTQALESAQSERESLNSQFATLKQRHREAKMTLDRLELDNKRDGDRRQQTERQIAAWQTELATTQTQLQTIAANLPSQQVELAACRARLDQLEGSEVHGEWQGLQTEIKAMESEYNAVSGACETIARRQFEIANQLDSLSAKITEAATNRDERHAKAATYTAELTTIDTQIQTISGTIQTIQTQLAELERKLGNAKSERDRVEKEVQTYQRNRQEVAWDIEKQQESLTHNRQEIERLTAESEVKKAELPSELPEVPESELTTEYHQDLLAQIRQLQKRIEAMEPVNMLALTAYQETTARLEELAQKLETLSEERAEILLRIENFTTLRLEAFKEAFNAVNINFQSIFAELSDGDGYLQLDDPADPFNGGLNLVAHPKGKPVQRLSSMSGGEKSLTALSFIFSLQRYRPSPFYAFDEVDMFLDGANVERLAKMLKKQAQEAQFLVVSLRRPTIESADRTIGVTQARGAYTQVLGINLKTPVQT